VIEDIIHIIFISLYTDYSIFEKLPLWKCSHLTCLYIIEALRPPHYHPKSLGVAPPTSPALTPTCM